MPGPLDGVRIVVLAGLGPVPFASMLLADMGADVVRVDRPSTRAARSLSQTKGLAASLDVTGRGVRSVTVDLKHDGERAALIDLIADADVFVEGFRPGVAERLGLGPDVLSAANPRLVFARLTGYGQDGPRSQEAGHDINYVAASGALSAMARQGEAPLAPVNLLGDYAGGGLLGAYGIVCAVLSARASGKGQVVDIAMVDGVSLLTARLHGLRAAGSYSDEAGTNYLDSGAPFYDTYPCADGKYLAVGALEADFYAVFLSRLGVDTSAWPDQEDRDRWPELRERIGAVLATRTRDEWAAVYAGSDACVSAVLSFDEAADDPHNVERGTYRRIEGTLHPSPAPRFSRTPARTPTPATGESSSIDSVARQWRTDSLKGSHADV